MTELEEPKLRTEKVFNIMLEQITPTEFERLGLKVHVRAKMLDFGYRYRVQRYGTIRCFPGTHTTPGYLTSRGKHELPQALRFDPAYVRYIRESGAAPGVVVSPAVAEHLCGLPAGWTDPRPLGRGLRRLRRAWPDLRDHRDAGGRRLGCLDLFSGCLGLGLGLSARYEPLAYCDINPDIRELIAARIRDGAAADAPIFDDVRKMNAETLAPLRGRVEAIMAGFPCIEVSHAGTMKGFGGENSSLFREVVRLVDLVEPGEVALENVAHITSENMRSVWQEILTSLDARGYSVRWCTLAAYHAGRQMERKRWFAFATKHGLPARNPEPEAKLLSIAADMPPVEQRLLPKSAYPAARARLKMCGNTVVPQQAALAAQICGF